MMSYRGERSTNLLSTPIYAFQAAGVASSSGGNSGAPVPLPSNFPEAMLALAAGLTGSQLLGVSGAIHHPGYSNRQMEALASGSSAAASAHPLAERAATGACSTAAAAAAAAAPPADGWQVFDPRHHAQDRVIPELEAFLATWAPSRWRQDQLDWICVQVCLIISFCSCLFTMASTSEREPRPYLVRHQHEGSRICLGQDVDCRLW